MRRALLLILALIASAAITGIISFLRLTAPVAISDAPPLAPTLALADDRPTPAAAIPSPAPPASAATSGAATPIPARAVASATRSTTVATPPGSGRRYRIDPRQSRAAYTAEETFLFENNRFFTAVGVTRGIAGEIVIDRANPAASRVGEIVVDISQLTSDDARRDNAIRRTALESARYPLATFRTTALVGLPPTIAGGQTYPFQATGDLTIRTATRRVTWEMTATLNSETLHITATLKLKMSDFGVPPPRLSDLRVEDDLTLTLEIVALPIIPVS